MSKSASSGRSKRSRTTHDTTTTTPPGTPSNRLPPQPISADQRHAMIAESAYFRAEARGFNGGDSVADWLASEHDVDALLSRTSE